MSLPIRKFVAVFLAIWLPLFSGAALATSVFMQMPQGTCHEMMQDAPQDGQSNADQAPDHQNSSCDQCSICHLACGSYLGMQQIHTLEIMQVAGLVTPYLFSFHSITSTPLVPPPLV